MNLVFKIILGAFIGIFIMIIELIEIAIIAYAVINKNILLIIIFVAISMVTGIGFSTKFTKNRELKRIREKSSSQAVDIHYVISAILGLSITTYSYFHNFIYWEVGITLIFSSLLLVEIRAVLAMLNEEKIVEYERYIKKALNIRSTGE